MRTIQEQWDSYRALVLPKEAPPLQIAECQLAFYAGANAMFGMATSIGDGSISDDAGVMVLEGLHQELIDYSKGINKS